MAVLKRIPSATTSREETFLKPGSNLVASLKIVALQPEVARVAAGSILSPFNVTESTTGRSFFGSKFRLLVGGLRRFDGWPAAIRRRTFIEQEPGPLQDLVVGLFQMERDFVGIEKVLLLFVQLASTAGLVGGSSRGMIRCEVVGA